MEGALIFWLVLCAGLNLLGWLGSSLHHLKLVFYAGTPCVILFAAASAFRVRKSGTSFTRKLFRRCRRPLPALFVLTVVIIFAGAIAFAPTNYDALTYRLPRILNWLSRDGWFWIQTPNDRMNYATVAWEWLATPLLLFSRTDRLLFLFNYIGFLFMPGLVYSVFRVLGVKPKVAWWWMWIVPMTFGYVTQAGSIGNDLIGALFGLTSVYFAFKARVSRDVRHVWLSLLATALLTGSKLSNLPLALPCVVALFPVLSSLFKRLIPSFCVLLVAAVISALPIMALNQRNAGNWTGDADNHTRMQISDPVAAVLGNGLLLMEQSFVPPVLPHSNELRERAIAALPESVRSRLKAGFPHYFTGKLSEIPVEEGAGLGLGVTLGLLGTVAAMVCGMGRSRLPKAVFGIPFHPVLCAAGISIVVYILKMGSEASPRLMLPYYPWLIAAVIALPAQSALLRFKLWRGLLVLIPLFAFPAILLGPARPVVPAEAISKKLLEKHPELQIYQRIYSVYSTYSHRNDLLAGIRAKLPEAVTEVGFLAGSNDTDYSLWRPFGKHRVVYLNPKGEGLPEGPFTVEWAVIKQSARTEYTRAQLESWLEKNHGKIVASESIVTLVAWGGEDWLLVHFSPNP